MTRRRFLGYILHINITESLRTEKFFKKFFLSLFGFFEKKFFKKVFWIFSPVCKEKILPILTQSSDNDMRFRRKREPTVSRFCRGKRGGVFPRPLKCIVENEDKTFEGAC